MTSEVGHYMDATSRLKAENTRMREALGYISQRYPASYGASVGYHETCDPVNLFDHTCVGCIARWALSPDESSAT